MRSGSVFMEDVARVGLMFNLVEREELADEEEQ
jgi:hypothetical protein